MAESKPDFTLIRIRQGRGTPGTDFDFFCDHYGTEVEVAGETGEHLFFSLFDIDGLPFFYSSKSSVFDEENAESADDSPQELGITDYWELYQKTPDAYTPVLKLLACLVTSDALPGNFISSATGKKLSAISLPETPAEREVRELDKENS